MHTFLIKALLYKCNLHLVYNYINNNIVLYTVIVTDVEYTL